jgi:hypothetical protein
MSLVSVGVNLTAGAEQTIYTVPQGYVAVWNLMYLSNTGSGTKTISIDWYKTKTATHVAVMDTTSYAAKDSTQLNGQGSGVVLDEGDQVHANPEAGSTFSIICTFDLQRKP